MILLFSWSNEAKVPKILQTIDTFSKASGLRINLKKCELMPIHHCHAIEAYNIPIKPKVKYSGMYISNDFIENKIKVIDKCQNKLNSWWLRDVSLLGGMFLTTMESISRLIYPAYTIAISNKTIKITTLVQSGERKPII